MISRKPIFILLIVTATYFLITSLDSGQTVWSKSDLPQPIVNFVYDNLKSVPVEATKKECDTFEDILYVEQHFKEMEQDDPRLIRYVRNRYVTPIQHDKPLKLKRPGFIRTGLGGWVKRFYNGKRNGTFLEVGANDGELANTIELEIEFGWSGLLIECNPKITPRLRTTNRKSWIAEVCLSTTNHPQMINLSVPETWDFSARIGPAWNLSKFDVHSNWTYFDNIEGVPLYTILASIGMKEIDFFNFDIEGTEFEVLKTFPFDKVLIKVLIVEVFFLTDAEKVELKALLHKNGLIFIRNIELDQIYIHESLLNTSSKMTVEYLATH